MQLTLWHCCVCAGLQTAVDLARRHDLGIHIDITFPAIPCAGQHSGKGQAGASTAEC